MSRGIDVEEESGEGHRAGQAAQAQDLGVAEVEERLAELADDIGELIERAPVADREALHDYAVSLVREKLPAAVSQPAVRVGGESPAPTMAAAAGVHLIGYGILLLPVGFLMMLVFAPLGTILLFAGVAMSVVGLVGSLIGRLRAT